jgi:hypothetical protein
MANAAKDKSTKIFPANALMFICSKTNIDKPINNDIAKSFNKFPNFIKENDDYSFK